MDADIRILAVGPREFDLLLGMYDRFDPLGAALGLPPRTAAVRRSWIGDAVRQKLNVAAFSPEGEIVGHCFLASGDSGSAEMAVFVRQDSRMRGIGTALVKRALKWACAAGLRRVWGVTSFDNRAALRLLWRCGLRAATVSSVIEMEVELSPCASRK